MPAHAIVAIGYGANAHEPLMRLFKQPPATGATYIVLKHLSRHYRQILQENISKLGDLVVREALPGMPVMPDHVYVAPSSHNLSLRNDRFYFVRPANEQQEQQSQVDFFLQSLSRHWQGAKIAVVLSGRGFSVADGVTSVKAAKGRLLVQHPDRCDQPDMAISAIESVTPDYVGIPEDMNAVIAKYCEETTAGLRL